MPALSKPMNDELNEQINTEIFSAYLYLSMSAYCEVRNLPGAAHWLRMQWHEELGHATKLVDYVAQRRGGVVLKAVAEPPAQFGTLLDLFRQVLAHEQEVTASIYRVYNLSVAEKDYAAQGLLQWYVNEQLEEENAAMEIISMLEMAGDSGSALLVIDRQLAQRGA